MTWINYLVTSKFAKGSEGHMPASELLQAVADHDGSEAYYNHFDVTAAGLGITAVSGGLRTFKGATGPARPAFGLVGFDFDSSNPQDSLNDVSSFIRYLKLEYYYVAFSGSKGFHVSIPFEYFGLEADENLPRTLNKLAHMLKVHFPTLDTSVYNIGRKFRVLNSRHPKTGLYKTIVSGLNLKSMDEILEYCKTRSNTNYAPFVGPIEPDENLVRLVQQCQVDASYDAEKVGTAEAPTALEAFDGKLCIKRLLENRCPDGERNTTALILVNDLYKTGKAKDYCYSVIMPWAARSGLPAEEVTRMIEDIYTGNRFYNHGCLEPLKANNCSAKCSLWAKLSPEKRPTPVDAPKSAFIEKEKRKKLPATDYITAWLDRRNVDVTLSNLWTVGGVSMPLTSIVKSIYHDFHSSGSAMTMFKTVTTTLIEATVETFNQARRLERLQEMQERFRYRGDNDLVEQFIAATLIDPTATDVEVMKHWLWTVKRNIWQGKTEHHMMPIFTGKTGSGKSRAVEALTKPLHDMVDDGDLSILGDDRNDFRLMESFIMFFDEMAKANKVDVESLKKKITADYLTYRVLGSNAKNKGKKICSFIGTSNYDLIEIIKDPTSVRRYWEFKCKDRIDWSAINGIDYLTLWQGIDENKDDLYITDMQKVHMRQETFRELDSVEEWLTMCDLFPHDDNDRVEVTAALAYDAYVSWLQLQRRERYAFSLARWGRAMKKFTTTKRSKVGMTYCVSKTFLASTAASNPDFLI